MNKLLIALIVLGLIYALVLTPAARSSVNEKIKSALAEGYGKILSRDSRILGKPNCTSNAQCGTVWANATCDVASGNCVRWVA